MNDDVFIAYCAAHSCTERKLFSGAQIRRLLKLASSTATLDSGVKDDDWCCIDLTDVATLAAQRQEVPK